MQLALRDSQSALAGFGSQFDAKPLQGLIELADAFSSLIPS